MNYSEAHLTHLLKTLSDIGILLSKEKNHTRLLQSILTYALSLTHADAGTIYTCIDNKALAFEILINQSMNIHIAGPEENPFPHKTLPLYNDKGEPNKKMLAPAVALSKKTINIPDAYQDTNYDLSGTKKFDESTGYRSQSILTIPMTDHLNDVIGVLQIINSTDPKTKKVKPFSTIDEHIVESLASQAAVTLSNRNLINAQRALFNALIQLIAKAVDEKSPYTANHCRRVPLIAKMLADAACLKDSGPLKDFTLTDDERYEMEVAAWLHDCGKISTPEWVMDKATKLGGLHDNIHLVDTRFEVLKRDATIAHLQKKIEALTGKPLSLAEEAGLQTQLQRLDTQREILRESNVGGESFQTSTHEAIQHIGQQEWVGPSGQIEPLLSEKEIQALQIPKGTLSKEERQIINNHVSVTIKMLESLPYPKHLKKVPLYAGAHHETLDGKGYPKQLTKNELPIPARIIAIADIFEALTSNERPYKKAIPMPQVLDILKQMKTNGKIDPDLYDVFIEAKVYEQFADSHLKKT